MKVLIIGPLGAGKSSLSYEINKKFSLPRLNIDEVCRNPADGSYYSLDEQFHTLNTFIASHPAWVAEGCQKYLYETMTPDLIVDMRVNPLVFIWRFTLRFIKAKRLIGKDIAKDLPVQAYHYRKISFQKIKDYTAMGCQINAEIKAFLSNNHTRCVTCKTYGDYQKVFDAILQNNL